MNDRKSKLSHSLNDILYNRNNDEISYFVLFMDSKNESNLVKFLLDVNNFKQTVNNLDLDSKSSIHSLDYESNDQFFI